MEGGLTSSGLDDAREFAREVHASVPRKKDGTAYLAHTSAVAELVAGANLGEPTITAAFLHDSVENTPVMLSEIRARFGREVARLVEAMTEDDQIEDYVERKRAHRATVEAAGPDALAIYGADRVANMRAMRRWYGEEGEAVEKGLKTSLDDRMTLWQEDLEMLAREAPELPFLGDLELELRSLRADRGPAA